LLRVSTKQKPAIDSTEAGIQIDFRKVKLPKASDSSREICEPGAKSTASIMSGFEKCCGDKRRTDAGTTKVLRSGEVAGFGESMVMKLNDHESNESREKVDLDQNFRRL
jgi:hypothetical protein